MCLIGNVPGEEAQLKTSERAGQLEHQGIVVSWRLLKTSPGVELFGIIVDRMNQQRANANVF